MNGRVAKKLRKEVYGDGSKRESHPRLVVRNNKGTISLNKDSKLKKYRKLKKDYYVKNKKG